MEKSTDKMHIDLNSCFATVEQQANPLLRGKPVAVAAYLSPGGCILAPSVEAKRYGVKTGMRVRDGKILCPQMIVVPSDPDKYRAVHTAFRELLGTYTDRVTPKSIDEFVLDFAGVEKDLIGIGREIKKRIRQEIGEWLSVSIGIGPNRFLAKTASNLIKPDGLAEINCQNYGFVFAGLKLTDLCGIKNRNALRLNRMGIWTVWDFYNAGIPVLKAAFESVAGYYWYMRLHGFEVDDVSFARRSYGNSYSLPRPFSRVEELAPILQKLVEKTGARMRKKGYRARGVHLGILYRDGAYWHHGEMQKEPVFDSRDIYKIALKLLINCPYRQPVHTLAESCYDLTRSEKLQLSFWEDMAKKEKLVKAVDEVNDRWGKFVITPARMMDTGAYVPDRIAFGGVKELEEIIL